jgi:hypothetical protein
MGGPILSFGEYLCNFRYTISQKELEHQVLLFWSVDTLSIPASLKVSLPTIHIGITFHVPIKFL